MCVHRHTRTSNCACWLVRTEEVTTFFPFFFSSEGKILQPGWMNPTPNPIISWRIWSDIEFINLGIFNPYRNISKMAFKRRICIRNTRNSRNKCFLKSNFKMKLKLYWIRSRVLYAPLVRINFIYYEWKVSIISIKLHYTSNI
jgi:hypothetical protein